MATDPLIDLIDVQDQLQREAYGMDIKNMPVTERIDFIKDMTLALTDELHEALAEVGWKPWASSRHVNVEAFKGELVDAFHFFMNLCLAVDMRGPELRERYVRKNQKNLARQLAGYDGISAKCAQCKRALDDEATTCTETQCSFV